MTQDTGLLAQAAALYGAEIIAENTLGNSDNLIYELKRQDGPFILRISPDSEEKRRHVAFELNWLEYLSAYLPQVAGPIKSAQGQLYERVTAADGEYLLCAFQKAPGREVDPSNPEEWNEGLFAQMGELMGKIHALTKPYTAGIGVDERLDWRRGDFFTPEYQKKLDWDIRAAWERTLWQLDGLPKSFETYGVIHGDIHHKNFFLSGSRLTLFDFDDCMFSWYAYDIATTWYFALSTVPPTDQDERNRFGERFIIAFLQGYQRVCDFESNQIHRLGLFLRYRRLVQYLFVHKLSGGAEGPHAAYLDRLHQEILEGRPVVEIDLDMVERALAY